MCIQQKESDVSFVSCFFNFTVFGMDVSIEELQFVISFIMCAGFLFSFCVCAFGLF